MPLMPKRYKHRKWMRGRVKGNATRGNFVAFGDYGLQALEAGWITARQIEAGRIAATHFMSREGKLWIRIFPHKPVTSKPAEVRMGKGKGEVDYHVAVVKPGVILYGRPERSIFSRARLAVWDRPVPVTSPATITTSGAS